MESSTLYMPNSIEENNEIHLDTQPMTSKLSLTGLITGAMNTVIELARTPSLDSASAIPLLQRLYTSGGATDDGERYDSQPLYSPISKLSEDSAAECTDGYDGANENLSDHEEEAATDSRRSDILESDGNDSSTEVTTPFVKETQLAVTPNEEDDGMEDAATADDTDELPESSEAEPMETDDNENDDEEEEKDQEGTMTGPIGGAVIDQNPMMPPPIEVAFSFDTTGSMSSCIDAVKEQVREVITRLFMDIPSIRIAIIAHGDYCDKDEYYLTQMIDFTNDVDALCSFVTKVEGTGGGDFEECYELILNEVGRKLSWSPGTQRVLVMIGDAIPHPADCENNQSGLDWKKEADALANEMGIRIQAVQCRAALEEESVADFWSELASRTGGSHLMLDEFRTIIDTVMAICYRECGAMSLQAFEAEVRLREGKAIRPELNNMFSALHTGKVAPPAVRRHDTASGPSSTRVPLAGASKRSKKTSVSPKKTKAVRTNPKLIRKTPVSAYKVKKQSSSTQKKNAKKTCKPREKVIENKFALHQEKWSPWKLAMAADEPKTGGTWVERRNGHPGYRNVSIFYGDLNKAAIYEMAVQPLKYKKRYVVYMRAIKGLRNDCYWDTSLLKNDDVIAQLDSVINQGCKVYVRRLVLNSKKCVTIGGRKLNKISEIRKDLHKLYNYAWNSERRLSNVQRKIVRHGIVISQ